MRNISKVKGGCKGSKGVAKVRKAWVTGLWAEDMAGNGEGKWGGVVCIEVKRWTGGGMQWRGGERMWKESCEVCLSLCIERRE